MKSKKLIYLEKILRFMARSVIRKYKPSIVGVTGSVGKTSTKEAVALVLASKFRVRKNEKNYNNEVGLPLTIIGVETGGSSFLKWLGVFLKWIFVMIFPVKYPEILVLEMGVDRPGDMEYLLSFIPLEIGIFTNVSGSHLEFFKDLDRIAKEKGKIVRDLPESGMAILNADDERVFQFREKTGAQTMTFGFSSESKLKVEQIAFGSENDMTKGIYFRLNYEGKSVPVRLPHIIADHLVYAALTGVGAGIHFKMNLVEISEALLNFYPPHGRMTLIPGIKNSFLIDDTYNASPASVIAAINALERFPAKRKVAVLGDMLELGVDNVEGHKRVGKKIFDASINVFFGVGERMEYAVKELMALGYSQENIFYFEDPEMAGRALQEIIREGDAVLVKGSQGMRMEKVVEEVMAEPEKAEKILCRQSADWKKKAFKKL